MFAFLGWGMLMIHMWNSDHAQEYHVPPQCQIFEESIEPQNVALCKHFDEWYDAYISGHTTEQFEDYMRNPHDPAKIPGILPPLSQQ